MVSENRTKALQWWNGLTNEEKENFFAGYKLYTPATSHTQLTGREIQNIWAVQTNTQKSDEKFDEKSSDYDFGFSDLE